MAVRRDQGKYYQIVVDGHLEARWSEWFNGMDIRNLPGGEAVLCGTVVDQAALHGILIKVRDLGLPLISLRIIKKRDKPEDRE